MDGKHSNALNRAKVSMSLVQSKFPVAGAASGTIRKRQIEQGKGPVEKKARGEVPQPAFPPEELKRICLSSKRLEQWCHVPFFATIVTGCFVRVAIEEGSKDPRHCIAEIVSVMETEQVYQLVSKRTNLGFELRHAGKNQIVTLKSASNKEFTNSEFMQWKLAMLAAGMQLPTPDEIATKEKSLKEALNHTFTQKEMDFIVAKKNRFRTAPLNVAKRKLQLLVEQNSPVIKSSKAPPPKAQNDDYQVLDPFTRRKTRPIMVTNFKNESVRKAIYDELDRRYGCGSTEE